MNFSSDQFIVIPEFIFSIIGLELVLEALCYGSSFTFGLVVQPIPSMDGYNGDLTAVPIAALTRGSLLVAPCSAVASSETVSKFPVALAAWDVPALTHGSVLASPIGVAALFTTVAKFPAALAAWDVPALTLGQCWLRL